MILAGDIGGTKTVLALYDVDGDGLRPCAEAVYASGEHDSLERILGLFLEAHPDARPETACFGVAGPVIDGRSRTTNLPWELEEGALARAAGVRRATLLNDLEAAAYGMLFLEADRLCPLNPGGAPQKGNVAVIAAGTGLGEAILYWDGHTHHTLATEGGHADFAPGSDMEMELLGYLRGRFGAHVSYERVLSGPGLHHIYEFLRESGYAPEPDWLREALAAEDPSAAISRIGLAGEHPLCEAALDLFVRIYGAEAGNLALKCLSLGGVYVGGGIAPKILPALRGGGFMEAFTNKGRFAELLAGMPVNVALEPRAPLIGAAHFARRL